MRRVGRPSPIERFAHDRGYASVLEMVTTLAPQAGSLAKLGKIVGCGRPAITNHLHRKYGVSVVISNGQAIIVPVRRRKPPGENNGDNVIDIDKEEVRQ